MTADITVLLVDDHSLFRAGVRVIVDAQPGLAVLGEAGTGADAIELAERLRPDVVLTDVEMRPMNGAELTRRLLAPDRIARTGHAPRIVMLTTFDIDERASLAMRYGASGFLLKSATPGMLCHAIRAAHLGDAIITPRQIAELLDPEREPATQIPEAYAVLTDKEREVLDVLLGGANNQEVASVLFVSESTVKSHVSAILRKLGLRDRVQLVVHAVEHGYPRRGIG